jgi:hypothetical protein
MRVIFIKRVLMDMLDVKRPKGRQRWGENIKKERDEEGIFRERPMETNYVNKSRLSGIRVINQIFLIKHCINLVGGLCELEQFVSADYDSQMFAMKIIY